ncbi:Transglutaminase-like superfamily protein [Clostridium cavendishii DSM 21758]|uniref:Transglutaminase-like superfamily protein n=1 Tax=Clostridium cavendishii DSM 21758 TaxID=1121302 RepID=A0A1M6GBU7_9CLOT|nr:transglutaminase domain-containing protein [Clostridium cavendishii]SHJ07426.1 Transglutaminase-like superfamily protein [Clostridium cavendishii DSM 21758]
MNRKKFTRILAVMVFSIMFFLNTPIEGVADSIIVQKVNTNLQNGVPVSHTITNELKLYNYSNTMQVSNLSDLQNQIQICITNKNTSISLVYTGGDVTNWVSAISGSIETVLGKPGNDYAAYTISGYSYSYNTIGDITINFTYIETAAQSSFVNSYVNQTVQNIITPGMTDEQKEKAVNDYVVSHVAYDTSLVQHSAYAALVTPYKTVCQGYALLGYKMLIAAGLQARIISGTGGGEPHAWNLVKVNGSWYHLDMTWNDPIPDVPGRVRYEFFNLDDDQMLAYDHNWDKTQYVGYESSKPYVTSDSDILNMEKMVQTPILELNNVTVYNNIGKSDVVIFKNLKAKDVVTIYSADGNTVLGRGTASSAGGLAVGLIKQLDESTLKVLVSVKSDTLKESDKIQVSYSPEALTAKLSSTNVTVYNNIGRTDVVIFKNLKAKDVVTIYSADGNTVLGRGTASSAGGLAVGLIKQLDESALKVLVSVKSDNQKESDKIQVSYNPEGLTAKLSPTNVTVYNNIGRTDVVIFKNLKAKDVVTIYSADGNTVLGRGTASSAGGLAVGLIKQLDESALKVLVSVKSDNQKESDKIEVNYNPEGLTAKLNPANVTVYNNIGKSDVVIFKNLKVKDIVTVYSADGNTVLGRGTAAKAGDLAIALTKNLDESVLKVLVSVKSDNQKESDKVQVSYK